MRALDQGVDNVVCCTCSEHQGGRPPLLSRSPVEGSQMTSPSAVFAPVIAAIFGDPSREVARGHELCYGPSMRSGTPLSALERLRRQRVDEQRTELAVRLQDRERRTAARAQREAEYEVERARTAEVLAAETKRMGVGASRVADLVRSGEFTLGAAAREAARAEQAEQARVRERAAGQAVRQARSKLSSAEADVQSLVRHRERIEHAQARLNEQHADEAALEVHGHAAYRRRRTEVKH